MKNYVVLTHYQLLYSILHALDNKEKCKLWISKEYSGFSDDFAHRIKLNGPFEDVTIFETAPIYHDFFHNLQFKEDEYAFNTVLDSHFSTIFGDISNDSFYIFNEFQLYFAYIEKYCKEYMLVEDGYKSYEQQNSVLCFKGQFTAITSRIGTYFPWTLGRSPKFKKYIVNEYPSKILKHHNGRIEVCDYRDMEEKYLESMRNICNSIYDFVPIDSSNNNTLILTQPLARANYCMYANQFLLYADIVKREIVQGNHVYIKPHPADLVCYGPLQNESVTILSKNFPVEVYNYEDDKFSKMISYGSTAEGISRYADKIESIYAVRNASRNNIVRDILKRTSKKKLKLVLVSNFKEDNGVVRSYINTILGLKLFDINIVNYGYELTCFKSKVHFATDATTKEEALKFCINNLDYNYLAFIDKNNRISKKDLLKLHFLQLRSVVDLYVTKGQKNIQINNKKHSLGMFNILSLKNYQNIFISKKVSVDIAKMESIDFLSYFLENTVKVNYLDGIENFKILDFFCYSDYSQFANFLVEQFEIHKRLTGEKQKQHFEMIIMLLRLARILELDEYKTVLKQIDATTYFELTEDCQLINNEVLKVSYLVSNLFYVLFYKLKILKVINFLKKRGLYSKARRDMNI